MPSGQVTPILGQTLDTSEKGFFTAVLKTLGAPASALNLTELAGWSEQEIPQANWNEYWNPLNTKLQASSYNKEPGTDVPAYPGAAVGVQDTAATLAQSNFANIAAAFRKNTPINTYPGTGPELSQWSGGGYSTVTPRAVSTVQVPQIAKSTGFQTSGVPNIDLNPLDWLYNVGLRFMFAFLAIILFVGVILAMRAKSAMPSMTSAAQGARMAA